MSRSFSIAFAMCLLVACGQNQAPQTEEGETPQADPATERAASENAPEETNEVNSVSGSGAELPEWAAAFSFSETPTLDAAEGPVRGVGNGHVFDTAAVFFEDKFDNWSLVVADRALPSPTALLESGTQSVNLTDLPQQLAVGLYTKEFGPGGGFWQLSQPENPEFTTSWNARNAYVLEITKWEVVPYDNDGDLYQQAGTASGRVVVVYRAAGDFTDSWVAGEFEDAPVRYRGRPRWMPAPQ